MDEDIREIEALFSRTGELLPDTTKQILKLLTIKVVTLSSEVLELRNRVAQLELPRVIFK